MTTSNSSAFHSENSNSFLSFSNFLKWTLLILIIGVLAGLASALLLKLLIMAADFRGSHLWVIALLPLGGLAIGYCYHFYGAEVSKGNNLLIEEFDNPKNRIPLKMAPMVFFGTLITHLFGGSAGREGTAVQMGGAIADQFPKHFHLNESERKTIIIIGISAGFASVFGTPLTGALFALEVLYFSKISFRSVIPAFAAAYVAFFTVAFTGVPHTHYHIPIIPSMTFETVFYILIIGIASGIAAMVFSRTMHWWSATFKKLIAFAPLRPFIGGAIIAAIFFFSGSTKYLGLGIPQIVGFFTIPAAPYDFLFKILLTGFTLGAGFKGGEVTPLFFIGAALGSALSIVIPLPVALLAGMGFVAVFSGATHTPVACTVMGMELFGWHCGIYVGIACAIAYFSSGTIGIYKSQIVKGPKLLVYQKLRKKAFGDL